MTTANDIRKIKENSALYLLNRFGEKLGTCVKRNAIDRNAPNLPKFLVWACALDETLNQLVKAAVALSMHNRTATDSETSEKAADAREAARRYLAEKWLVDHRQAWALSDGICDFAYNRS